VTCLSLSLSFHEFITPFLHSLSKGCACEMTTSFVKSTFSSFSLFFFLSIYPSISIPFCLQNDFWNSRREPWDRKLLPLIHTPRFSARARAECKVIAVAVSLSFSCIYFESNHVLLRRHRRQPGIFIFRLFWRLSFKQNVRERRLPKYKILAVSSFRKSAEWFFNLRSVGARLLIQNCSIVLLSHARR